MTEEEEKEEKKGDLKGKKNRNPLLGLGDHFQILILLKSLKLQKRPVVSLTTWQSFGLFCKY